MTAWKEHPAWRGRFAVALAVRGSMLGLQITKLNHRFGWWTHKASQKLAAALAKPKPLP
jgi:hypothetical protein